MPLTHSKKRCKGEVVALRLFQHICFPSHWQGIMFISLCLRSASLARAALGHREQMPWNAQNQSCVACMRHGCRPQAPGAHAMQYDPCASPQSVVFKGQMDEESWKRNLGGGIMEETSGGIWEASGRQPEGGSWEEEPRRGKLCGGSAAAPPGPTWGDPGT